MSTDAARDEFLTIATELEARAKLADEVSAPPRLIGCLPDDDEQH